MGIHERLYGPREFAKRSRVTVRTLHHYDRLGLLRPTGRSTSGYRRYSEKDLVRLQQIVTLKFIGFSLQEIRTLLDIHSTSLKEALNVQRRVLEQQRRELDRAIRAIACAEEAVGRQSDIEAIREVINIIQNQMKGRTMKEYYSQEAQRLIAERQNAWTPELQRQCERDWATLFSDVEAAARDGVAPDSPRAQGLVDRWTGLVQAFTGGHSALEEGLSKLWADQQNWPEDFKQLVFAPFAKDNPFAGQDPPRFLSDAASALIEDARKVRSQSPH
jgi:DNA-binding transcriptional MerR regulator